MLLFIRTVVIGSLLSFALVVSGQYAPTDFIIAGCGTGNVAVYSQGLVFQSNLATSLGCATGLDLLSNGNLASASATTSTISFYQPTGTLLGSFTHSNVGTPLDIKAQVLSNLYIAANSVTITGISDFTLSGSYVRTLGTNIYSGVALLPGNVLWAGHNTLGSIHVFDLVTGTLTSTIPLDAGQTSATSMYYSPTTNTVLITDFNNGIVYERTTAGAFVRQFSGGGQAQFGVTRGPGGDVYATDCFSNGVIRWNSTGTLLSTTGLGPNVTCPQNIVWAGDNVVSAANVSISGRVLDLRGRGLFGAAVKITDQTGNARTAFTNGFGYYRLNGVEIGHTYVLSALSKRFTFESVVISVQDDLTDFDFTPIK